MEGCKVQKDKLKNRRQTFVGTQHVPNMSKVHPNIIIIPECSGWEEVYVDDRYEACECGYCADKELYSKRCV